MNWKLENLIRYMVREDACDDCATYIPKNDQVILAKNGNDEQRVLQVEVYDDDEIVIVAAHGETVRPVEFNSDTTKFEFHEIVYIIG